jgi:repressor LexA
LSVTDRQKQILRFIAETARKDVPPTIREIGAEFGIGSTNAVNDHLKALERKGLLVPRTEGPARSRAFRLTRAAREFLGIQPKRCSCGKEIDDGQ